MLSHLLGRRRKKRKDREEEKRKDMVQAEQALTLPLATIQLCINLYFCFSIDHDTLCDERDCEGKEGEWALKVVQHLLTKLAVDNKYVIAPFTNFTRTLLQDVLTEHIGDTSFGT